MNPTNYYDGTAIPSNLRRPTFGWNGTTADVTNGINAGRFLVFHRDGTVTEELEPLFS